MKNSLKITLNIIVIETMFVLFLYGLFVLLNWDFQTNRWEPESLFCFGGLCIICFIPSVLIAEYGRLS